MANVYYREYGGNLYYCNTQKSGYTLRRTSSTISKNSNIIVELTDGKFVFPEDATNLFSECKNTTLDLSNADLSECTNLTSTFEGCVYLTSLGDTSNWDLSHVTMLYRTFINCLKLTRLDVANWNVSNVTYMAWALSGLKVAEGLEGIENWDVSNVTSMHSLLTNNTILTKLDLSNWNTHKLGTMSNMFSNCTNLKEVNLMGWDMSSAGTLTSMFDGSTSLEHIYVDENTDWSLYGVTTSNYMFRNCTKLPNWDGVTDLTRANTNWYFSPARKFHKCNIYIKR